MGTEGAGRACAPPPARTRQRAALGALTTAGAAVVGLGGPGGRGSALRLASLNPRGRRSDPARLSPSRCRPAASPPRPGLPGAYLLPCSAAAAPRTNRNHQLAPRLPGAPRPSRPPPPPPPPQPRLPPLGGAVRLSSPSAYPAAFAPPASRSLANLWEASCVGCWPGFSPGSCLLPLPAYGPGAEGGRRCSGGPLGLCVRFGSRSPSVRLCYSTTLQKRHRAPVRCLGCFTVQLPTPLHPQPLRRALLGAA